MSRPAPRKVRLGVFAENQLIADSLLHTLQKEPDRSFFLARLEGTNIKKFDCWLHGSQIYKYLGTRSIVDLASGMVVSPLSNLRVFKEHLH
jgi:hypothetical protein